MLTNPASGHGNAPHAARRAIARFQHRGIDVVEIVGDDAEARRQLVGAALDRGTDALVVAGGDGVISVALQALAGNDIPLGIIPAGTGNDHAREYGLPTGIRRPPPTSSPTAGPRPSTWAASCGGGKRTDKWFGTVAATGFDSLVSDRTNRMSWPHGRMRYNVAMIAELSQAATAAVSAGARRGPRDRSRT